MAQVCQRLSEAPAPDCEELLRVALAKHSHSDVQALAGYALALSLARRAEQAPAGASSEGAELYRAAEKQLEQIIQKHGTVPTGSTTLGEVAKTRLHALRHLSIGRPALEIEGRDLDDQPLKLSNYRGKVVVLDFWADWCGYCRQMYPQERRMVERWKDRPFVLLGINCDDDIALAKRAVQKDKLNWRSWWNGGKTGERITAQWQVTAYPTIYVLDGNGVIRYKDVRGEALEAAVTQLLQEMAGK
jgi:thiol-disulfide isomerase/thioredoxin